MSTMSETMHRSAGSSSRFVLMTSTHIHEPSAAWWAQPDRVALAGALQHRDPRLDGDVVVGGVHDVAAGPADDVLGGPAVASR
jgi:hypothetical protein